MSDKIIPESVVTKIRKLLALANDARGNENETSVAAEMAQKLLTEYNLDMAQLGEGATDTGDAAREKLNEEIAVVYPWQASLIEALSKNNFCLTWTERVFAKPTWGSDIARWRKRQRMIGKRVNLIVTIETYKYLVAAMERLCPYEDKRSRSNRSWYQGCADHLVNRLNIQRWVAEAESRKKNNEAPRGDGSSLVLADVYSSEEDLNNDLRFGYAPGTTAARRAKWIADSKRMMASRSPTPEPKPLTEKEKEAQRKADERWQRSYDRRQQREEAKIDRRAYYRGSDDGAQIGLDKQVNEEKKNRLT